MDTRVLLLIFTGSNTFQNLLHHENRVIQPEIDDAGCVIDKGLVNSNLTYTKRKDLNQPLWRGEL